MPTRKESAVFLSLLAVYTLAQAVVIGLRPDHFMLIGLLVVLFFASRFTRRLMLALFPFVIFAVSYDWMRVYPNYMVNDIDVRGIFETEKSLFGIAVADGESVIPCQYFAEHHNALFDFLAGVSYLCWVPVPVLFGAWLFFMREYRWCLHFTVCFLLCNLIGFAGYYVHPAAPPWYALQYGFDPILNTPGNVGGLIRFDEMVGIPVFQSIYVNNSNVFAAVPSLHAAYMLIATIYAVLSRRHPAMIAVFALITLGIWCTAVYSGHHYIIDVLLGILCACLTVVLFEKVLMRWPLFARWMDSFTHYVSK